MKKSLAFFKIEEHSDVSVILCYKPVTGTSYVKKSFKEQNFKVIESIYKKISGTPHCVPMLMSNGISTIYEPYYSTTLQKLLETSSFTTTEETVEALYQLTLGLHALHALTFDDGIPLSHRDYKPDNIFVNEVAGKRTYTIGDYDLIGFYNETGHEALLSPEWVPLFDEKGTDEAVKKYGQPKDVWQLGLAYVSTICNRMEDSMPPVKWVVKRMLEFKEHRKFNPGNHCSGFSCS